MSDLITRRLAILRLGTVDSSGARKLRKPKRDS